MSSIKSWQHAECSITKTDETKFGIVKLVENMMCGNGILLKNLPKTKLKYQQNVRQLVGDPAGLLKTQLDPERYNFQTLFFF